MPGMSPASVFNTFIHHSLPMKTDPALCSRISAFEIDRGSPELTFVRRLARENVWTPGFSKRVVREYLRFVYLACISEKPVTPSVAVDQAWHLHLCYTRSYWTDLCGETLERPLHHGPTRGGSAEDARYRYQYEHTLRLYEREFGERPPPDIWPPSDLRFAPAANPLQVTADRFIVIDRKRFRTVSFAAGIILIAFLFLGAYAATAEVIVIILLVAAFVFLIRWRSKHGTGSQSAGGDGCGAGGFVDSHSKAGDDSGCSGDAGGGGDSGCGASGCGGGGCGGCGS